MHLIILLKRVRPLFLSLTLFLCALTPGVAERFVSKAMNLLCFASPTFAPWKDMVRDLYFYVLKKKADFDAGRRVLFLQEQHKSTTAAAAFHASSDSAGNVTWIPYGLVCTNLWTFSSLQSLIQLHQRQLYQRRPLPLTSSARPLK